MKRTHLRGPFADFLGAMDDALARQPNEAGLLNVVESALAPLLADGAWCPSEMKAVRGDGYQSFALYIDPQSRYSVASFVWGPGQATPIHNHTVWGVVGVLEGQEQCEEYTCGAEGSWQETHRHLLLRGAVDKVSPTIGDVHIVRNGLVDRASISIHVYGGDIGRIERSIFNADGTSRPFISGYANATPWIEA
jgi:3-mercaptopropionate dioxygenase